MLRSSRDEDQRKRDDSMLYSIQQQLDDLRRQLKENLARQQWFEELYKQGEGRVSQLQLAQDRLAQDIAQTLHARQIDDARVKAQVADLATRIESPDKQLRDLRAQVQEVADSRKGERDLHSNAQRQIDDLQRQIRELNAHLAKVNDAFKQVRDTYDGIEASITEVRQEAVHIAELQRMEEQRLRRQGMELQGMFEALRQQFGDIASKSQRVDDVRRQLTERIDEMTAKFEPLLEQGDAFGKEIQRVESAANDRDLASQKRLESMRTQMDAETSELRAILDQRTDRYTSRFNTIEERLREIEQNLGEIPARFEALERKDEVIGSEADAIEEWLVMRQLAAFESVLDDVRKRRKDRAGTLAPPPPQPKPEPEAGSVYNPSGLIKSVRDARPPKRPDLEAEDYEE